MAAAAAAVGETIVPLQHETQKFPIFSPGFLVPKDQKEPSIVSKEAQPDEKGFSVRLKLLLYYFVYLFSLGLFVLLGGRVSTRPIGDRRGERDGTTGTSIGYDIWGWISGRCGLRANNQRVV